MDLLSGSSQANTANHCPALFCLIVRVLILPLGTRCKTMGILPILLSLSLLSERILKPDWGKVMLFTLLLKRGKPFSLQDLSLTLRKKLEKALCTRSETFCLV